MTDSIDAFLNSDVGKKARAKAIRAIDLVDHRSATSMDDLLVKIADAGISAFLSSLAEQGALREALGENQYNDTRQVIGWRATWRDIGTDGFYSDFPAFILRRE